jgi:hypothetical protein
MLKHLFKIVTLSALALSLCSCRTTPVTHGIPNLAQVEIGVWRGGQPNAEGWQYLATLGVKRDIKLNPVSEGSDNLAVSNGMQVVYLPISTLEQTIGKPNSNKLYSAVMAITSGTYIHCKHGQDRTGLIVGAYRVRVEHWTKKTAYEEMQANKFHPLLRGLYWSWQDDVP